MLKSYYRSGYATERVKQCLFSAVLWEERSLKVMCLKERVTYLYQERATALCIFWNCTLKFVEPCYGLEFSDYCHMRNVYLFSKWVNFFVVESTNHQVFCWIIHELCCVTFMNTEPCKDCVIILTQIDYTVMEIIAKDNIIYLIIWLHWIGSIRSPIKPVYSAILYLTCIWEVLGFNSPRTVYSAWGFHDLPQRIGMYPSV